MKIIKKLLFSVFITLASSSVAYAAGGYLVQDGVVNRVEPNWGSEDGFVIKVTGGTGYCANARIVFPLSVALVDGSSDAAHKRLYSAAILSLTTGMVVDVYNDIDGANIADPTICHRANYIYLKK